MIQQVRGLLQTESPEKTQSLAKAGQGCEMLVIIMFPSAFNIVDGGNML